MTSYDSTGLVHDMKVGGPAAGTTAQVSFQFLPDRPPQEAATAAAHCVVQTQQPDSKSGDCAADDAGNMLYSVEILYHDKVSMPSAHIRYQEAAAAFCIWHSFIAIPSVNAPTC